MFESRILPCDVFCKRIELCGSVDMEVNSRMKILILGIWFMCCRIFGCNCFWNVVTSAKEAP